MTVLSRPVERVVATLRGEQLVVRLTPEGITFRYPRQRRSSALLIPYGVAFVKAAFLAAAARQAAKKVKRVKRGKV